MSFFPRSFITHQAPSAGSASSFTPLFRLLDDFENYQSSCSQLSNTKSSSNRNSGTPALRSFNPRFDVKELADAYELHGELPGVEQKDLNIEFTDNETLLIKGHSVRDQVVDNLNGDNNENATPALETSNETTESLTEQPHASTSSSSSSHQASVADAPEEDDKAEAEDNASTTTTGGGGVITPATTTIAESSSPSAPTPQHQHQQPQQPEAKYWIAERSVGTFARSFSFPVRVDQDAVTARLQNGILSVRVPKVKRPEGARRIVVA